MIKIYHNPRCSKSREALAIIEKSKKKFEIIDYLNKGLSSEEISKLQKLLKLKVVEFVRTKEKEFKAIDIDWQDDKKAIKALIKTPKLLERPIVIHGQKAVIGRPPENVKNII